jgi:hypothetical protein
MINGLSNQIKSANRIWLGLAIISILIISFQVDVKSESVSLPFGLSKISKNDFYPFSASILSILIISYGAAQSQSIRSRKLINRALREIKEKTSSLKTCDIRDIFDVLAIPSINRTVPLAQLLLGKDQFYPEKDAQNKFLKVLCYFYQIILKLVSYVVVYCLPAYALFIAFLNGKLFDHKTPFIGMPIELMWLVSGVAVIILTQLLCLELMYAIEATKKIFNIE